MKLFVDDIRHAPDESWTVTRNVSDSIRAINMFDFDVISLDHDIEGSNETFDTVALYIESKYKEMFDTGEEELAPKIKPKIILHTANPAGALRMQSILNKFDVEIQEAMWWD